MDAVQMHWSKGHFDAAFSVLGMMFLGSQVPTVLADMRRAVRPGGVVAVVNWATPRGAPVFDILAQASRDLDDPGIGTLEALLPGDLSREALGEALLTAGLVDVHTEPLDAAGAIPTSESFLTELETFFVGVPGFGDLTVGERERLNAAIVDVIRPIEEGNAPRLGFHANLALGRVPTDD
jgi:SAM-dependent methyltransferase